MKYLVKNKVLFLLLCLIITVMINSSCNDCSGSGPSEEDNLNNIYFTTLPINSNQTSIFKINSEGRNLTEIVKNAILYSSPSIDGKICYISTNEKNKKAIFTCSLNGENIKQISVDDFFPNLNQPVISPDGRYIAINTSLSDLYIATVNGSFWRKATNNFARNSLPSFSPDGSLIAFYESNSLSDPWIFKIVKTSNLQEVVYEKHFKVGVNKWYGDYTINWTKNGDKVFFSAVDENMTELICFVETNNFTSQFLEVKYLGAVMPSVFLDSNLISFVGKDGNIWAREFSGNNIQYFRYTNSDTSEINLYPNFSTDGKKIIFNRYFRDDYGLLKSSLMLFDKSTNQITSLCENSFRGFWGK